MKAYFRSCAVKTCLHWMCCAVILATWPMTSANAGVMLNGTRIILGANERSVSTIVSNTGVSDYAVQAWINDAADSRDRLSPFIAMPALFKVRAGEEQVVRIIKTPGELPKDRESVFYFNAQEIPVKDAKQVNSLKVAVRTRIKLFYRPSDLLGTALEAPKQLSWKLIEQPTGTLLRISNPSAYHVTFIGIRALDGNVPVELSDIDMLPPMSSLDYPLKRHIGPKGATVEFSTINDQGGYQDPIKAQIGF
ncbi:molecular chaperone [Pseudomonas sp. 1912-s]|uniref:fimbrial biogenesis chaperone n=1 Tax=Pseudomonas sp. 1912-s TaxID=3033802 RepID=UPI0023DE6CF2|nr:molecular chaperone [Pseudomonas sp. 1912-s]MDF3199164.1 molecular chaperone [Pseudomonas sp. 1912-s]